MKKQYCHVNDIETKRNKARPQLLKEQRQREVFVPQLSKE